MLRCPRCHAVLSGKGKPQACRCGFDIMKEPTVVLSPLGAPAIYRIEKHVKLYFPKIIRGMEITYSSRERYVGDAKSGKRHGIGELYPLDGNSYEGVWIEDVYSEKLSNLRKTFLLTTREFRNDFWDAFELTDLPQADKDKVSEKICEELEVLVGSRISIGLPAERLHEFHRLESDRDVEVWLKYHCPDYHDIILSTAKDFLDTIIRDFVHGTGRFIPQRGSTCASDFEDEDDLLDTIDWAVVRKAAEDGYAPAQRALGSLYLNGEESLHIEPDTLEAAKWLQSAADQGEAKAQYLLGNMLFCEMGGSEDIAEAVRWYQLAADQGLAEAQSALADIYWKGISTRTSRQTALKWYRLAAEQGFAPAQYKLGRIYGDGSILARDFSKAAYWHRLAAEQGRAEAQCDLGVLYRDGSGVEQNYPAAAKWFRRAAEQGHDFARFMLGCFYESGIGVEQDYVEARQHFTILAEQGYAYAQRHLGSLYRDGKGVAQDYAEALKWFHLAADQGLRDAQSCIGDFYRDGLAVEQDHKTAIKWYRMAADKGGPYAMYMLGHMYKQGLGVQRDGSAAAQWFLKAAQQGDADAQCEVGCLYRDGQGADKDPVEAAKWFQKSARQGNKQAQKYLEDMRKAAAAPQPTRMELLRSRAESGDAAAQYELGCMLINPKSKSSCEEAKRWLSLAREQGHENARLKCIEVQKLLANIYRYGVG